MSCRKLSKIMRLRLRTSRWVIIGLKCNIMQHYYIEHILIRGCDFSACPHIACQDEAIPGQWCSAKWKARGETYEGARMWCQVPCHGVVVISVPLFFGRNMFPMSFLWTFQLVELKTYSSWCDAYAIIHLSPACSACIHLHVDKWTYYRSMCGWCPAGNFPRSCGCAWGHHVE